MYAQINYYLDVVIQVSGPLDQPGRKVGLGKNVVFDKVNAKSFSPLILEREGTLLLTCQSCSLVSTLCLIARSGVVSQAGG